jgi:hypothetical protein
MKRPMFGSSPKTPRSFGFFAISDTIEGSEAAFEMYPISKGMAPTVFVAISITANITIYLQALFFPVKDDSRWFIN